MTKQAEPVQSSTSEPVGFDSGLFGFKTPNQAKFLDSIRGWVYANINAIAEYLAFIEIKLYKKNKDGTVEEVKNSPILDALYKVNNYTTKFDHFWLTAAYLESIGESPWFLDKDNSGKILGIYPLNPTRLEPKPDEENSRLIGSYLFTNDKGHKIEIPLDQIVPLRYPDPANPVRGLGTMQACARTIDVDDAAERWNFAFFKNNASAGTKLKIATKNLTPEQKNKIKSQIKSQYQGVEKSQQLWVLFDDMDVEPFGTAPKDMDFNGQQKWTADKIRGLFRVPKALLAQTEGVNLASAKVAQEVFIRNVIKPKIERIVQQLNEFYVPQFENNEDLFLDYVDPTDEDREMKLKTYESGIKNYWLTINEIRSMEGMEGLGTQFDQIYMPINLVPVGTKLDAKMISSTREHQLNAREKLPISKNDLREKLAERIKNHIIRDTKAKQKRKLGEVKTKEIVKKTEIEPKPVQYTQEQKDNFWRIKANVYDKFLPKVQSKMDEIFDEQKRVVLKRVRGRKEIVQKKDVNKFLLIDKEEEARLVATMTQTLVSLIESAGDETFDFLGVDMSLNPNSEAIQKYTASRTVLLADATTEVTNRALTLSLQEGFKLGEGVEVLSKRVATLFDKAKDYRSFRVARTEVTRFNTEGTEQAFIESGVVKGKEWVVNPGACPYCLQFQGKTTQLGSTFAKMGDTISGTDVDDSVVDYEDIEHPPLHVNCRCDIVPVLSSRRDYLDNATKELLKMKKSNIERDRVANAKSKKDKQNFNEKIIDIESKKDKSKEEIKDYLDTILEK